MKQFIARDEGCKFVSVVKGYSSSIDDLQKEMRRRYCHNSPPMQFLPEWYIEPTISQNTEKGVILWKWSIENNKWIIDVVIEEDEVE